MRAFVAIVVSIWFGVSSARANDWKAAAGKIVITPPQLMWMSGYGSRTVPAEGKVHDLWAKALILENEGQRFVLISLDLVGVDRGTSQTICDKLQNKFQIPRASIVLACSHTHCGPVVGDNLAAMYSFGPEQGKLVAEYTKFLPERIVELVGDTLSRLAPAKLSWATGATDFAVNRRENKEADVPMLREAGKLKGPIDHDVPVLAVRSADDKLLAIAFGYACHATVMSFQLWCGDYPGFAMAELEKNHPGAVALFWAGCGADQNPLPRRKIDLAEKYGKQLAGAVDDVLKKSMTPINKGSLRVSYSEVPLDFDKLPTRDEIAKDAMSSDKYIALRGKHLLAKIQKEGPLAANYPYPVQTIRLDPDLHWVTLGGEVVVEYALRIKKELGPKTWVMGYANDVMAYIPSAKVLREGGYEGDRSMIYYGQPTVWGPKVEETILNAVHEQRTKLK